MSNRVFSCKHIIYPEWKCILVDFLQRSLVPGFGPKIFLKRWNLSWFVHFQKQYPNDLLSCQTFCWFSFDMLSIICTIVLSTFLAFIYFTSQLHICYLTSCSFHPILYIGMLMLCLFALSDFVYMHFDAFTISFIKFYVFNSKLLCAWNRCCCAVDPYDLSPTLCDSNTTSIC